MSDDSPSTVGQPCDLLIQGRVLLDRQLVQPAAVLIRDGEVLWSGPAHEAPSVSAARRVEHRQGLVLPGFLDLHLHGAAGADASDGDPSSLQTLSRAHAAHGTTALCPTVLSGPKEQMLRALEAIARLAGQAVPGGARILGANLEGPFLNPDRAGAQPADHLCVPDPVLLQELLAAGGTALKIVTVAPELPGALDTVARLRDQGVVVCLGHSVATYAQARAAIDAGACLAAHTFNAMAPLHHREPGLVGAVLESDRVAAEAIADGVHLSDVVLRLLWRLKGPDRLCLITDCTAALDAPASAARLGSQPVTVADGAVRLPDGSLAGSSLSMDRALRRLVQQGGASLSEAAAAASRVPAGVLGLDRLGSLAPGSAADLVLLDHRLEVAAVLVAGQLVAGSL